MNNTIDFKTAKTIDSMSKKLDHIDDTVTGFFSVMHMAMKHGLGSAEPYFAATSPVLDLTVIRPDDAPHILACFDEADEGIGISENEPLGFRYNPKQVVKLMGQRYLVGPVIFHRFDEDMSTPKGDGSFNVYEHHAKNVLWAIPTGQGPQPPHCLLRSRFHPA